MKAAQGLSTQWKLKFRRLILSAISGATVCDIFAPIDL